MTHKNDDLLELFKSTVQQAFRLTLGDAESKQNSMVSAWQKLELLVDDAVVAKDGSRLKELVPSVGPIYRPLPLALAFKGYDAKYRLSSRRHMPPSFHEIRHIVNNAQIHTIAATLELITFDGDCTLYVQDGSIAPESPLVNWICSLLQDGIAIALVTAAGYQEAERYEARIYGLLEAFRERSFPPSMMHKFYVMGGECNYLFRANHHYHLERIPFETYATAEMRAWQAADIQEALDLAAAHMESVANALKLKAKLIRKERAVGMIAAGEHVVFSREQLDEVVLEVQDALRTRFGESLPTCCFNAGPDVWCDIGNKAKGCEAVMHILGCSRENTLHVGDQFLSTGNDFAARGVCGTLWVANPRETAKCLKTLHLLRSLGSKG